MDKLEKFNNEQISPKEGDLQVWWIPQVPMMAFTVPVKTIREAKLLLEVLGNYDLFQLREHIKPDYCNAGGLNVYINDVDDNGTPGWETWYSDEGFDINEVDDDANPLDWRNMY